MRLLDVGCGWGGMVLHAARHHGVRGGRRHPVARSRPSSARKRVAEAGLSDLVEMRYQDYRDVRDGPYDAISSIGMFEHVGLSQLEAYFAGCSELLRPRGRLLNHGISRRARVSRAAAPVGRAASSTRYVFPDGELHEVGTVVRAIQERGFEVRHVESLREHYALTLRAWLAQPRGELGRRGRAGRRGAGPCLAPLHRGGARHASKTTPSRCTRCSR